VLTGVVLLQLWWSGWGIRNDEGYDGSLEEAHDGPARQQDVKRPTSGHCTPKVKRSQASGRWMDIVPLRERIYSLQLQAIAVDVQRPQHLFWTPQARLNSCTLQWYRLFSTWVRSVLSVPSMQDDVR